MGFITFASLGSWLLAHLLGFLWIWSKRVQLCQDVVDLLKLAQAANKGLRSREAEALFRLLETNMLLRLEHISSTGRKFDFRLVSDSSGDAEGSAEVSWIGRQVTEELVGGE